MLISPSLPNSHVGVISSYLVSQLRVGGGTQDIGVSSPSATSLELDESLPHLNELALVDEHLQDDGIVGRFDVVLHLHGLNGNQGIASLDMLADLYEDLCNSAWHRALNVI